MSKIIALMMAVASPSTSDEIVVTGILDNRPAVSRTVMCANPAYTWIPSDYHGRSVPMGKGRYMAAVEWKGGYYEFICSASQRAAFDRMTEAERDKIRAYFAAKTQEWQRWEENWHRKMRDAEARAYKAENDLRKRDRRIVAELKRRHKEWLRSQAN